MTRQCLAYAEEGARRAQRDFAKVRRCGFIIMIAADDDKAARAALIRKAGYLFRSKGALAQQPLMQTNEELRVRFYRSFSRSIWPGSRKLDNLRPLVGLVCDKLSKVGRRARHWRGA
jgi:hypothetical protein